MKDLLESLKKKQSRCETLVSYFEEYSLENDVDAVGVYIPFATECDVLPLVEKLWEEEKGVYVFEYPPEEEEPLLIPWKESSNIVKMNGVRLPLEQERVSLPELDLMIVPGLAFTEDGARLGRGAGFYDQILEDFDGTSIGVCFKEQLLEELPVEEHDVPVDLVWAV